MTHISYVEQAIKHLNSNNHHCCIEWQDYVNYPVLWDSCDPEAFTRAMVLISMPKGSTEHLELSRKISTILGCKYITYEFLVKLLSRVLGVVNTFSEFEGLIKLSLNYKARLDTGTSC